jgi:hypothetical protein
MYARGLPCCVMRTSGMSPKTDDDDVMRSSASSLLCSRTNRYFSMLGVRHTSFGSRGQRADEEAGETSTSFGLEEVPRKVKAVVSVLNSKDSLEGTGTRERYPNKSTARVSSVLCTSGWNALLASTWYECSANKCCLCTTPLGAAGLIIFVRTALSFPIRFRYIETNVIVPLWYSTLR